MKKKHIPQERMSVTHFTKKTCSYPNKLANSVDSGCYIRRTHLISCWNMLPLKSHKSSWWKLWLHSI